METYATIYNYGKYIIYILYALIILGLWDAAPDYLNVVEYFFQIFVGLVLIYANNPFTKHRYSAIDKQIAFSAGMFLLTSTTVSAFLRRIRHPLQGVNTSVSSKPTNIVTTTTSGDVTTNKEDCNC